MPRPSDDSGLHYLGVAPVEFDGRGEAIISRQHLRFAPEFGGHSMSTFQGNPEGLANTGADFDDADVIEFGDEGWTYYDSLGGVPSMDDVYAESLGDVPSMDNVYAESLGARNRPPPPLSPRAARPYLRGSVSRPTSSRNYYIVHVLAPDKRVAKSVARMMLRSKRRYRGKFNQNRRRYGVNRPEGMVPSPGVLPWAPHVPMPPMLVPIPAWKVRIPKKGQRIGQDSAPEAPSPGVSAQAAPRTTITDRMVHERRQPLAPRALSAMISDYAQLSAEQEYAEDQGIPQNLPYGGLAYPGGEGDSYNADPYVNTWEEQGVNQGRYDSAVAQLMADEFGSALPYGVSDTGADIAPVDLLAEEQLWDAAFGGDVYNEGSGILYDGYQDGTPMTPAQMHALSDPADVNFGGVPSMDDVYSESLGVDPYSNYFGRGCGC